jgi:hypothetical protein
MPIGRRSFDGTEKSKGNRWLAEKLKVNENAVLKWPLIGSNLVVTLYKISSLLEIDMRDLFDSSWPKN